MDYPVKTLSQLRPILLGFRKSAGLTQAMMASRLGVTQQTYAQLEANPASASVARLFKVLRALNVGLALTQTGALPSTVGHAGETTAKKTARATPAIKGRSTSEPASAPTSRKTASITARKRENW